MTRAAWVKWVLRSLYKNGRCTSLPPRHCADQQLAQPRCGCGMIRVLGQVHVLEIVHVVVGSIVPVII